MLEVFNNRVWSTWTSLFFLLPAYIAWTQDKMLIFILLSLQTVFSILYHLDKPDGPDWWWRRKKLDQHFLQITDTILAIIISVHVVMGLLAVSFNFFTGLIIFSGFLSLYLFFVCRKKYEVYHGLWHITASLTILFWLLIV
jgi:hypothetical protein